MAKIWRNVNVWKFLETPDNYDLLYIPSKKRILQNKDTYSYILI